MPNEVPISLLKPHPKNAEYFSPPAEEERESLKRSIASEGVRDPLKVTPDYTVVAGHLRLEIARELGLEKVPVQIVDGDPEYLEYLLIADNVERRVCNDPIKKAKRAEFLKRYWGVREGSANPKGTVIFREGQNVPDERKTLADVADAIGETEKNVKRLLKLNDLIPEFQALVSQAKLSQTAAYSLAFLPPEEQRQLLQTLGESGVCGLSVREAQELRRELDAARKEKESLQGRLAELEDEKSSLSRQLAGLQDSLSSVEEEIAEKLGRQYQEKLNSAVAGLQAKLREKEREIDRLAAELKEKQIEKVVEKVVYEPDPKTLAELDDLRGQLKAREEQIAALRKQYAQAKEELDKAHKSLNNYLEANAELKGHGVAQETRFRTSLTTAAKVIGEALSRVKAEFRPAFRRNTDLVERINFLASHLEQAAGELRGLLKEIDVRGDAVEQVIDVG